MITVKNSSFSLAGRQLVKPLSVDLKSGQLVAVLGPNGAGKSTLLQLLGGLLPVTAGEILYLGKNLKEYAMAELAVFRAYQQQQQDVSNAFLVNDVLEMGRYPHAGSKLSDSDKRLVDQVAELFQLDAKRNQEMFSLSGGEQQRVHFARNLLQLMDHSGNMQDKVLFLDEPLNNLDLKFQFLLLDQARELVVKKGGLVVTVVHDMNMAYRYADRVLIMINGELIMDDVTETAMDPQVLSRVFDVQVDKMELKDGTTWFHSIPAEKQLQMNELKFENNV